MAAPVRLNALSTTVVAVRMNRETSLFAFTIYNASNAVAYVQCFDQATPTDVSLGTTAPTWVIPVPTVASVSLALPQAVVFAKGLQVAATTTATGSSAPSSALDVALAVSA